MQKILSAMRGNAGPMTLMQREPVVREVIATTDAGARALEDPLRRALLDILVHRPMSVEEMTRELAKRGWRKAPTTVRHHVDLLKGAGFLDLVRLEEAGGAVVKYYAANARVLDFPQPAGFESDLASAIDLATDDLARTVRKLLEREGKAIDRVAEGMRPCPYCNLHHFREYAVVRVLDLARARALQRPDVKANLEG